MLGTQENKEIFENLKSLITQRKNDEVKSIIEDLRSLDVTDDSVTTLLHLAARKGNKDLVKFFIDSGCDINVKNSYGSTPLLTSMLYNQFDVVTFLVEANAEINITNANGKSAVNLALNEQRRTPADVVKCFCESLKRNGASSVEIGQKFLKAGCSLALAICMNDADMTRMILENEEKLDQLSACMAAMGTAMEINSIENVRVLLQYKPSVDHMKVAFCRILRDFILFRREYNLELAKYFIERLISWNVIDENTVIYLEFIFKCAIKKIVVMLLDQKIDVYVKETFGKDLFFYLHGNSQPGIVELLISRKIDSNGHNDYKRLSAAVCSNAIEVVQYLLDEGVDPNVTNNFGRTVLFISLSDSNESAELLLYYGADVQVVDCFGKTIFDNPFNVVPNEIAFKHLALLEDRGVTIKQQIRDGISSREKSRNFYQTLRSQIEEMKQQTIIRSFTLYDIVAWRPENIADCIRDESVLNSILDSCKDEQWRNSHYVAKVKMHVSKALEIIDLRKKAVEAIYSCTDYLFSPDHLALELIVSFLTYHDLRVFV